MFLSGFVVFCGSYFFGLIQNVGGIYFLSLKTLFLVFNLSSQVINQSSPTLFTLFFNVS